MVDKEKIKEHYDEINTVISDALNNSFAKNYNNEEEGAFAKKIRNQLEQINNAFKGEIEELERSSEWDKFCISFFGETNAGKSTILESLRIIYDEETRLQKILENKEKVSDALDANNKAYSALVEQARLLREMINSRKKTISLKVFIISIIIAVLIPILLFMFLF